MAIVAPKKGRPTKLTPLMMDRILMLAAFSLPDEKIAYALGIIEDTFKAWKRNEYFSTLLQKARDNPLDQVENSLFLKAKGLKITKRETYYDKDGKATGAKKVEEELPPDTGACIAVLANKRPKEWRRNPDFNPAMIQADKINQLVVYIPEVKSEQEFLAAPLETKLPTAS